MDDDYNELKLDAEFIKRNFYNLPKMFHDLIEIQHNRLKTLEIVNEIHEEKNKEWESFQASKKFFQDYRKEQLQDLKSTEKYLTHLHDKIEKYGNICKKMKEEIEYQCFIKAEDLKKMRLEECMHNYFIKRGNTLCCICLEIIKDDAYLNIPCLHRFHKHCLIEWKYKYNYNCPECREV